MANVSADNRKRSRTNGTEQVIAPPELSTASERGPVDGSGHKPRIRNITYNPLALIPRGKNGQFIEGRWTEKKPRYTNGRFKPKRQRLDEEPMGAEDEASPSADDTDDQEREGSSSDESIDGTVRGNGHNEHVVFVCCIKNQTFVSRFILFSHRNFFQYFFIQRTLVCLKRWKKKMNLKILIASKF